MRKSSKNLTSSQQELESSQMISTQQQNPPKKEIPQKQEKQLNKLSSEQLNEAILTGTLLADQSEIMRLKLRHKTISKIKKAEVNQEQ